MTKGATQAWARGRDMALCIWDRVQSSGTSQAWVGSEVRSEKELEARAERCWSAR